MSIPISTEQRMLTKAEFEVVERTHYPVICGLSKEELAQQVRLLRDYRNKARDISRQQRREMRGKAAPRGAQPASDNTGTSMKKRIFSDALKRASRELNRIERAEAKKPSQSDFARRALELKRQNRVRHHPRAGRTANAGLNPVENPNPTVSMDPREIGRVSQAVKSAQARRDT